MHNSQSILAEAEELFGGVELPKGYFARKPQSAEPVVILESGPLDAARIEAANQYVASGTPLGVQASPLLRIRHTHHRMAQLLAGGMNETTVAKLCNISPSRLSILKNSPAFAELMTHYASVVDDEFAEFFEAAANLSLDALGRLQEVLDDNPEKFTVRDLMELVKVTGDRTGHAPIAKSVNLNVNTGMGDKLRAARERFAQLAAGGSDA